MFYTKAIADIHLAKLAISSGDKDIDDATILFHLQQAAEKLLKSLMAFRGVHFEKIHILANGIRSNCGLYVTLFKSFTIVSAI